MAINRATLSRLALPAKLGIGVGSLVAVAAGYYFFFHSGLEDGLVSARTKGGTLNADLSKARAAEQAYQKDLAELADREQRQKELNQILPASTEYPAFLSAVQNVANVSGIGLTAWSPLPEVPEQFYARVPMKVELRGRYHQVAKFFHGVGQLDRVINMENITLTDPKLEGEDVVVKVDALATAFRAKVDGDPAAAPVDKRGAAKQGKP